MRDGQFTGRPCGAVRSQHALILLSGSCRGRRMIRPLMRVFYALFAGMVCAAVLVFLIVYSLK